MQLVASRTEISCALALELVAEAVAHGRSMGWEVCASVCDSRGVQAALLRTDNVIDPAVGFAIDKAYTAAVLRRSTADFAERALSKPPLQLGLANRERILVFPGGLPILKDGVCIGGIGVSGATDSEDVECARAALGKFGLL
jgi:uncharacterized protein GlcG (DUF336 family)